MRHTLYLLPGLLCDERVWQHQQQNLRSVVDIRIPDFKHHDSLDAMAAAVLAAAPPQFYLAGHSMGSRVALAILAKAPQRILKLALLDTGLHPAAAGEQGKRQALIDLAANEGMAALARSWGPPMVHPARQSDAVFMQSIYDMVESYTVESFRNQARALLQRPDATPFLAKAPSGTLLLCGREDAWSPPSQHEEIARALPDHPPVVLIDNSGHMAPMEQPEAVTAAMRNWLQRD
jgi:pimeloyl-ACP methyl ester carboxylesterase